MKQTIISFLMVLLPMVASADAVEIDGIWYNIVTKGNFAEVTRNPSDVSISGSYTGDIVIPEKINTGGVEYPVTKIGDNAFFYSEKMKSVTIPNSVTTIGQSAFYGCTGLTSITIPSSVTSIGGSVFTECGLISVHISDLNAWFRLKFVEAASNPLYYAHHLYLNGEEIKNLVIPNDVTYIGDFVFSGCSALTSVTIPNSVTTIGQSAFYGCTGLTSITIPNSVTSIGQSSFSGCSGLTSVTISNSVASIDDYTFHACSALTSVTIPNSVTTIGQSAFYGCTGLTSITISNSVTSIGQSSFSGCSGLTSVTIPNSVRYIRDYAFTNCSGLTSVTIPNSVISISNNAFQKCENLTDVYCESEQVTKKSYGGTGLYTSPSAFDKSYPEYITLHVPSASIAAYQAIEPWSKFKTIVPLTPKCATPTISYNNNELSFSCATEGVEFISEVTVGDAKKYYDSKINLSQTYNVSVYAMKDGYEASDVATKEITISGGSSEQPSAIKGDVNEDGKVDVADHVELSKIIMASGTNPTPGPDPTPVNPSADDLETDKITASFIGGAYSSVNGRIQSGSKLNVKFSNKSSKSVTLTKMQLNDADTSIEGNNLQAEEVVVPAGQDASYTITVGLLGISKPVIIFTYKYNNKTYLVKDEWKEIEIPEINIPDFNF